MIGPPSTSQAPSETPLKIRVDPSSLTLYRQDQRLYRKPPGLKLAAKGNAWHSHSGLTPTRRMICADRRPFLYQRRAPGIFAPNFPLLVRGVVDASQLRTPAVFPPPVTELS